MSATAPAAVRLDVSALTGAWHNTNRDTRGIARFIVTERADGGVDVVSFGTTAWPLTPATVYGDHLETREAMAFSAIVDLGYADVHLQANIKGGVLVVATFNRFRDGSGRSNYFMREFYYRVG